MCPSPENTAWFVWMMRAGLRPARSRSFNRLLPSQITENPFTKGRDQSRRGYGKDPSPNDPASHSPLDRGELGGTAHPDDGPRNGVGRGNGNTHGGGHEQRNSPAHFSAKTAHGLQLGDLLPHRFDDPPSTGHGPEGHGRIAANDDPPGDLLSTRPIGPFRFPARQQ